MKKFITNHQTPTTKHQKCPGFLMGALKFCVSLVFGFWCLVFVSGCARFEAQKISPLETAAALENRSLDEPGLRSFIEKNLRRELKDWPPK